MEELELEIESKSKKRPFENSEPQISSKRFMSEVHSVDSGSLLSKLSLSDNDPSVENYDRFIQKNFTKTIVNPFDQIYQLNQQLKIQILSSELGVPMNLNFFALAYKFKAISNNCFSREVFIKGLIPLLDNTEKLVRALNELEDFAHANVEKIFLFAFYLFKDNEHQKLISFPEAVETMCTLIGHLPHTYKFASFLKSQTHYKGINFDQWQMLLLFNKSVKHDYTDYDINDAWPVMIDDFVLYSTRNESKANSDLSSSYSYESDSDLIHSHYFGYSSNKNADNNRSSEYVNNHNNNNYNNNNHSNNNHNDNNHNNNNHNNNNNYNIDNYNHNNNYNDHNNNHNNSYINNNNNSYNNNISNDNNNYSHNNNFYDHNNSHNNSYSNKNNNNINNHYNHSNYNNNNHDNSYNNSICLEEENSDHNNLNTSNHSFGNFTNNLLWSNRYNYNPYNVFLSFNNKFVNEEYGIDLDNLEMELDVNPHVSRVQEINEG
jgi:hypothetical protein